MDFAETEDQKMIRGMVREFAEDVAGPTCDKRDKEQIAPIEEFKKFAELGFAGMTIPEKYGGQKLDDISEAIVVEELSRVDPSLGVMIAVHVGLCSMTIALSGNEEQKEKYLPKLASGEFLGAYSLSEAGSGTDAAAMVARATDDGEHYTLNGEKMWVTNGTTADIFVLFAKVTNHPDYGKKSHGGVTCFIIEKGFEGFDRKQMNDPPDKCIVQIFFAILIAFSRNILSAPGLCDPNGGFIITVLNSSSIASMGLVIHLISKFSLLEYSFAILIASSSISNPVTSAPSIAAAIDSLPVPHPKSAIFPDKLPAELTFLIISKAMSGGVEYCSNSGFGFSKSGELNNILLFINFFYICRNRHVIFRHRSQPFRLEGFQISSD